jgi:hypothetical protein
MESDDGAPRYLVKWKSYEADPHASGWLTEDGMGDVSRAAYRNASTWHSHVSLSIALTDSTPPLVRVWPK